MKNEFLIFEKEKIINCFLNNDFGTTVTYDNLQDYTRYNLNDEFELYKFKSKIMKYVKDRLIDYGYIIKAIRNVGYYILKQNQIQSYTYRNCMKRSLNQYMKAERILNNTIISKLNKEELEKHNSTKELNHELINTTTELFNNKKYKELKNNV